MWCGRSYETGGVECRRSMWSLLLGAQSSPGGWHGTLLMSSGPPLRMLPGRSMSTLICLPVMYYAMMYVLGIRHSFVQASPGRNCQYVATGQGKETATR